MEVLDTLVNREIKEINDKPIPPVFHQWKLIVKANGREVKPLHVTQVILDRLFVKNYADEMIVTATFTAEDYFQNILPYKEKLEATLIKLPLMATTQPVRDPNRSQSVNHYVAQLVEAGSEIIAGDNPLAVNKMDAGKHQVKTIQFQLYNPVIDFIRKRTFGTVFRDTAPMSALKYILMKQAKPETAEVVNTINGIDVVEGFTTKVPKHIIVPHMTPLAKIPDIINEEIGGFYPTGFAFYLMQGIWYVFPPFDSERFNKTTPTLTIIKIPSFRMPNSEKTWRFTGNQLIVLSTRETKHQDMSESNQLNTGNAVRFVDSYQLVNDFGKRVGNKLDVRASKNVTEVLSKTRSEGDYVTSPEVAITADYNLEYSKLALKNGSMIQTAWENSSPELLVPGMPVRYIFADGKEPKEMYGTLQAVETLSHRTNVNAADGRFTTLSLLTIFVSREDPTKKPNQKAVQSKTVNN